MIGYGLFTVVMIIASKFIIQLLYTDAYMGALYPFIILLIGFFISATFTIPTDNVLASMRKLNFKIVITICSGILNIILNISFINKWGIIGASITTTITNSISAIANVLYVKYVIHNMKEYNDEEI